MPATYRCLREAVPRPGHSNLYTTASQLPSFAFTVAIASVVAVSVDFIIGCKFTVGRRDGYLYAHLHFACYYFIITWRHCLVVAQCGDSIESSC